MKRSRDIVKIAGLYFRYKRASQPVFENFRLEVAPGERLAILAPSEAGKSTLALCLIGLIPRMIKGEFHGRVEVDGCLTSDYWPRELASRVGVLFQDFEAQLFSTRVDQEVAFGPENLGLPHPELRRRVAEDQGRLGPAVSTEYRATRSQLVLKCKDGHTEPLIIEDKNGCDSNSRMVDRVHGWVGGVTNSPSDSDFVTNSQLPIGTNSGNSVRKAKFPLYTKGTFVDTE